jgi:predicted RecA/RadA family phage recombinase
MVQAVSFIQEGRFLEYTNASGSTIEYSQIVTISGITDKIFVAAAKILDGEKGTLDSEGCYEIPAVNNASFSFGDKLYYDSSAGKLTKISTENTYAGYCIEAKVTSDTTAKVKLGVQQLEGDSAAIALIGDLDVLETTAKTDAVAAINEVKGFVDEAYVLTTGGIPATDLDSETQAILNEVSEKYVLPTDGIPATDLDSETQAVIEFIGDTSSIDSTLVTLPGIINDLISRLESVEAGT